MSRWRMLLLVLFAAVAVVPANAGAIRFGAKATKATAKVGAKVVAKAAKLAYKAAY